MIPMGWVGGSWCLKKIKPSGSSVLNFLKRLVWAGVMGVSTKFLKVIKFEIWHKILGEVIKCRFRHRMSLNFAVCWQQKVFYPQSWIPVNYVHSSVTLIVLWFKKFARGARLTILSILSCNLILSLISLYLSVFCLYFVMIEIFRLTM